MQPVPTAPTAAKDGGLSTHVLHMTRLHAKRQFLVELRVINGPFEGGCRLQSGGGAWLACNTSGGHPVRLHKHADRVPVDAALEGSAEVHRVVRRITCSGLDAQ